MNWYISVLKKYATFSGRARRTEYWMFTLFNILIYIALAILAGVLGSISETLGSIVALVYGLYGLGVLIPSLAVTVRRLQDTGRDWYWILVSLIPLVGGIILLIFTVQDSQPGENKFGPNPKEGAANA